MRKSTMLTAMIPTLILATATWAFAGPNDRMARQQRRIEKGVETGRLTRSEANSLKWEQERVERLKSAFLNDGRLSRTERRSLEHRLDRADRNIFRYQHNERTRFDRRHDDRFRKGNPHRDHRFDRHGRRERFDSPYRWPNPRQPGMSDFYRFRYHD
ncbi:MAG: hypothetical protein ACOWWM_06920 [Desulfobacterales bacterium]